MAVTMADITKLRQMSGAGMMDCKKALDETDGDMDKDVAVSYTHLRAQETPQHLV